MATLVNLIPYPWMETGWTGTATTEMMLFGQPTRKLSGTTGTPEVTINTSASIALVPSHIYYARVYGYQPTACGSVGFYWPIAEPSFRDGIPVGAAGVWNLYSFRNGRSSFSAGSYQLRLDFNNGYAAGTTYFGGCMLIDLTAAFGAGNEPEQAWCDKNIPAFAGTYEITAARAPAILTATLIPNPAEIKNYVQISVSAVDAEQVTLVMENMSGEYRFGEV